MGTTLTAEEIGASRAYHQRREAAHYATHEARRKERLAAVRRAIRKLAPGEPRLRAVYLFGSILRSGRFGQRSDVDVAVDCGDPAAESRFWRTLEDALDLPVDVRSLGGAVARAVKLGGECVYARKHPDS